MDKPEVEIGAVYRVVSRNLQIAVYVGNGLFIGIREKFGSRFLDTEGFDGPGFIRLGYYEFAWSGEFIPTEFCKALEPIGKIEGIPLTEQGDPPSVCAHCRAAAVEVDPRPATAPVVYRVCTAGCPEDDPAWGVNTYYNSNVPLFEALDEFEKQVYPNELDDWYSRRVKYSPDED